ncbi:hypothetical protein SBY92_000311 [Candida maltosa Xu316]|uniref:Uncharacterized protein n=1 Tax=Candida maltosa (strain Xu316) TaxID=1245528 RepID=M3HS37_CANMX|nr:hypothetical protein G210_4578 [Candida maltosa Xu316]
MKFLSTFLLSIALPVTLARTFHLATNQNVACLEIDQPTTLKLTKTIGTASGENPPVLIFNYNERSLLPIPNFNFLVTEKKIDDYFDENGFLFERGMIGSSYNDILVDTLEYNVEKPDTYCIYSPVIDGYEYRVEIDEPEVYTDNVIFCIVNIVSNLFYSQFFNRHNKVIFKAVGKFTFIKVIIFSISLLLSLKFNIIQYTEYAVSALDDIFTTVFLSGYGTLFANYKNQNLRKIIIATILTVTPSVLSRYFDLKQDYMDIVINNEYYRVVNGILGPQKFDGLSVLQRIIRDVSVHRLSPAVAFLYGVSKMVKFVMFFYTIRKTLATLSAGPTKSAYKWTVAVWLFIYPFLSFAGYPDLVYNYYSVTDYGKVLASYLLETVRNKYIILLLDEFHWVIFYLVWFHGNNKGLVVEDISASSSTEKKNE